MNPRSPFLLATIGLALSVFPAYSLTIASDDNGAMARGGGAEQLNGSSRNGELQEDGTVLVSLTGDALGTYLQFLGQVPPEGERSAGLVIPMKVRHAGKDVVLIEHTAHLEAEPNDYRLELSCTLPRSKITHGMDAESKPATGTADKSDATAKPQPVGARTVIRDFDECSAYKIQLWECVEEMAK